MMNDKCLVEVFCVCMYIHTEYTCMCVCVCMCVGVYFHEFYMFCCCCWLLSCVSNHCCGWCVYVSLTGAEGGGDPGSHHRPKQHIEGEHVLRVVHEILQQALRGAAIQSQLSGTVTTHKLYITHTHTHAHTHAHTHTYTHTAHAHTHTYMHTQTHTQTHICVSKHTWMVFAGFVLFSDLHTERLQTGSFTPKNWGMINLHEKETRWWVKSESLPSFISSRSIL